jgi:hypothetical protein
VSGRVLNNGVRDLIADRFSVHGLSPTPSKLESLRSCVLTTESMALTAARTANC